jgi:hypothetical protein
MARIEITNEREAGAGWSFDVTIVGSVPPGSAAVEGGVPVGGTPGRSMTTTATRHEVRLSWADYEYWSHGLAAPAAVVELVLGYMLAQAEASLELKRSLDLARVRRRWPEVDEFLASRL